MFIYPLFVCEGEGVRREVTSMPGVFNLSVDEAVKEAAAAKADGVPGVLLFGLPAYKDEIGLGGLRRRRPGAGGGPRDQGGVPDDAGHHRRLPLRVHLHGHCGLIVDGEIANDATRRRCWCAPPSRTPRPARTSSRRRT